MIEILDKKNCCGCAACVQICPKQCISMQEDEAGFLYPNVNKETCIDCHLCEEVCHVLNKKEPQQPLAVYAAKNINEQERLESSSGGLFIAFAKHIIQQRGVVFAAVFNDDFRGVHHTYVETLDGIKPMMRSKYMQSVIGSSYKDCEHFLNLGRKTLFTGTPCQIVGLLHYLRKPYKNLLTVDIICHGVPSPKVWNRYLNEEICLKHIGIGKISDHSSIKLPLTISGVNFRDKKEFGWKRYRFSFSLSSTSSNKKYEFVSSVTRKNPYMRAFLGDMCLRPSCHNCVAKDGRSHSDITIADYWGIDQVMPEYDDDKGTSLLIVNTHSGEEAVNAIDIDKRISDLETAVKYNQSYCRSKPIPPKRDLFWLLFNEEKLTFQAIVNKLLNPSFGKRVHSFFFRVSRKLKKIYR